MESLRSRAPKPQWWMPIVGFVIGGLLAALLTISSTPTYVSRTQLFVSSNSATSPVNVLESSRFAQERLTSYVQLLTGEETARRVIDELHLNLSTAEFRSGVSAMGVPDTVLINVSVGNASPETAQAIAETLASEFIALVAELERPSGGGVAPVQIQVTSPAVASDSPASPQVVRNLILGSVAGLLVGSAGAVLRSRRLERSRH